MIDNLARDVQVLWRADSLIGRIWLNVLMRRFGLYALAGLIALFGLGMANLAAFYALEAWRGPIWAAAIVAAADFIIAAIVGLIGWRAAPGPELDLARDVHKMALEAIQTDTQDVKLTIDSLSQEIRQTKDSIAGLVHNPLNAAAEKLLVPAVLSLLRGWTSKKE
ncbi:hypothetical protein PY365_23895 [Roseiarcaceae bacterium H3SJ34-1]|uniref:phage holin family protein n=1 Tax=Terripilifer ovatus TaxID=3032367 RepID=UPI003AB94108|nr:hypothetical protein [Roseiarcaceae bacterium H3SJ34-1]